MHTVQAYIGHNVHDVPTLSTREVCDAVEKGLNARPILAPAYTTQDARGMWQGVAEDTTIVTLALLETRDTLNAALDLVQDVCDACEQDAVLVVVDGSSQLIEATRKPMKKAL